MTDNSELVHRVARAIYDALKTQEGPYVGDDDGLEEVMVDGWTDLVALARAAITSMREPTYAMRRVVSFEEAEMVWPMMLDAGLSDARPVEDALPTRAPRP